MQKASRHGSDSDGLSEENPSAFWLLCSGCLFMCVCAYIQECSDVDQLFSLVLEVTWTCARDYFGSLSTLRVSSYCNSITEKISCFTMNFECLIMYVQHNTENFTIPILSTPAVYTSRSILYSQPLLHTCFVCIKFSCTIIRFR